MNTETLTTPSPELKQHMQDLRENVGNVAQDVKNQASDGLQQVQTEANARLEQAKGNASELITALRDFAAQHPLKAFGVGVLTGFILASWRRS
jgi:ElaB/YqjD/DUF883 family membrane-anchored ribosome-binding protein